MNHQFDVASDPNEPIGASDQTERRSPRYLGVYFRCCGQYCRIYLNRQQTCYEGRCPRCGLPVRFVIAPHGSSSRFFEVE